MWNDCKSIKVSWKVNGKVAVTQKRNDFHIFLVSTFLLDLTLFVRFTLPYIVAQIGSRKNMYVGYDIFN